MSARPGEEYVINWAMHLCNPPFSWREIAQEMAWLHVVAFKNMFTSTTSLHKDFVTVVLDSFLVNSFEKIIMATNNSGLN